MEILPEEAEFLHADGRTDRQDRQTDRQIEMTKPTDALRSSANAPKNETKLWYILKP